MRRAKIRGAARSTIVSGGTVVITGPAGIGKTMLAGQAVSGVPHLAGQCLPSLWDRSFRPLSHALRAPVDGPVRVVVGLVEEQLDGRCLVLEDLHWADPGTLEVLARLDGRVPLLVTTRGPDPFDTTTVRLEVPPLSRRDAEALLRRSGADLDDEQRLAVLSRAGGNPLLLRELGRSPRGAAPTLLAAVEARLELLATRDRRTLWLLALHGRPAAPEVVDAGGDLEHLVEPDDCGELWFVHDLVREAVGRTVPPGELVELHEQLARRGAPGDAPGHLLAAGHPEQAAELAEELADDEKGAERARLLLVATRASGETAPAALRWRTASACLEAAQPSLVDEILCTTRGGPEERATTGWLLARAAWMRGQHTEARHRCEEALALVDGHGSAAEAHLRVELASMAIRERPGDPTLADTILEALDVAERAGVDGARAHSLRGRSLAHRFEAGWDEHYRTARCLARDDHDADQECAALYWHLSAAGFFGPLRDALAVGRELVAVADETGQAGWYDLAISTHGLHSAFACGLEGRLEDALEQLVRRDPEFRNRAKANTALALARLDRGDLDGAREMMSKVAREARIDDDRALAELIAAELADATGDASGLAAATARLERDGVGFFGMRGLAESCAIHLALVTGEDFEVPRFSELCPPILSRVAAERAALDQARSGDPAAVDAMAAVARQHEEDGAARFAARDLHAAGALAARSGSIDRAEQLLSDADRLCRRHGLLALGDSVQRCRAGLEVDRARSLLTPRELVVVDLVATGATSRQVGIHLGISSDTVDAHVESARRKLGVATRRQAALLAARS